jgi:A/G-specific adenine glycosylase
MPKSRKFARRLLGWFSVYGRTLPWRTETDQYRLLATEKFLMQTDPGHVLRIWEKFFQRFPTIQTLATARESEIARVIKPIGFWRQRAGHLRRMASAIAEEYGGSIPKRRERLLEIFGIGEYTADAYLCAAYGNRRVAIDLNSRRVAQRLFYWPKSIPEDQALAQQLRKLIPRGRAREFNWGIIDFANLVCRRQPKCNECFATDLCRYYRLVVSKSRYQVPQ